MEQISSFDTDYEFGNDCQLCFPINCSFEQQISQNHYIHLIIGDINSITKVFSTCFLTEYFKDIPLVIIFSTDKTIYFPLSYHFIRDLIINTNFQNHFIKANSLRFKTNAIFSEEKGLIYKINSIFAGLNYNQYCLNSIFSHENKQQFNYFVNYYIKRYNQFPLNFILSEDRMKQINLNSVFGYSDIIKSIMKSSFEGKKYNKLCIITNYGQCRNLILLSETCFTE